MNELEELLKKDSVILTLSPNNNDKKKKTQKNKNVLLKIHQFVNTF